MGESKRRKQLDPEYGQPVMVSGSDNNDMGGWRPDLGGVKVAKTHFAAMRRLKILLRLRFRKKTDFPLERADLANQIHCF